MKKILQKCQDEIKTFSPKEKWFVFFSMFCCFLIAGEYGITRPASHSLFLTTFSSSWIPWLWLATVPLNFGAIYLYNRFLPRFGPLRMWMIVCFLVMGVNFSASAVIPFYPKFIFLQCMWKDIYILLVFKQLWSMIHCTVSSARAKYLYGLIYVTGTIGSSICSCIPGFLAGFFGSEQLFLFTVPFYLLLMLSYKAAYQTSLMTQNSWESEIVENPSIQESLSLVSRNRFLVAILLLVVSMQVSAGFMEFQFNIYLEQHILDKDLRTAYCGQLFGLMNILSMILQGFGSFLILQSLGLRRTHFLIPLLLLGSALCSWLVPSFALISMSYVLLKALDFSLFSVSREMLYIPFGLDEKYRAKAIIDVFAYRSSKALASLSILGLQFVAGAYLLEVASYVSIAIFIGWISVVFFMIRNDPELKQT